MFTDSISDYQAYWFIETKEAICIKIECNSQRFSLGHQHDRRKILYRHFVASWLVTT